MLDRLDKQPRRTPEARCPDRLLKTAMPTESDKGNNQAARLSTLKN
jgi:hypothetical protein